MTTYETLAYMKKRRLSCVVGDFVIQGNQLFHVFERTVSATNEIQLLCWRIIEGRKGYRTFFSSGAITPIDPLSGIFLHREPGENAELLLRKINWKKIAESVVLYAQANPVHNDLVLPFAAEQAVDPKA